MSDKKIKISKGGTMKDDVEEIDPAKVMGNIYVKEEIMIPDDPDVEDGSVSQGNMDNFQISDNDEDEDTVFVCQSEPVQEPALAEADSNQEMHYEAWRNFIKMKMPKMKKKKKNQTFEIFRDENYANEDRYTDDEDFSHYEY